MISKSVAFVNLEKVLNKFKKKIYMQWYSEGGTSGTVAKISKTAGW